MTTKNTKIAHPGTGMLEFGVMPEIIKPNLHLIGGNIYLRQGKHKGQNSGFGVEHIWLQHQAELTPLGYATMNDVPKYVADILVPGARIHIESPNRPAVLFSAKGLVILELRKIGSGYQYEYSVVTAYPKRTALGQLVGNL